MNVDLMHLKDLWQQAFGDPSDAIEAFFRTGFSPDRCNYVLENGIPVSALYWFDCSLNGHKFAYLYAIATAKAHRGKGHFRRLMEDTHNILKNQGYAGAVLVPAEKSLFSLYETLGYRYAATNREFACKAADTPVPLSQIDARQYEALRPQYLPAGSILQTGAALDYYATYGQFYKGADFLLACSLQEGALQTAEILGNTTLCGNILCALGAPTGSFRTPGRGKAFGMYYPFTENCPTPDYLGFDLA